ncbi:MAG TPA: CHAT domain-containing protein, partial [Thermoanaerobaculia bacterium]|nr:CHAT domain-containing protein [Thermoanaerobaculia bacterium]
MAPDGPKILLVYSDDSDAHVERVRALADRLRGDGFDCLTDSVSDQDVEADFSLLILAKPFLTRVLESLEAPLPESLLLVFFEELPVRSIPEPLQGSVLDRVDTGEGYGKLLRTLLYRSERMDAWREPSRSPSRGKGWGPIGDERSVLLTKYSSVNAYNFGVKPIDLSVFETFPKEEAPEPDPPRTAYARLEAPETAVMGEEIEVGVGLAEKPTPGVVGGPMTRPESSVGPYSLTVQLVAEGFRLREGETWRRELPVTAEAPYPVAVFHLIPEAQEADVRARSLQAFYEVAGQTLGMAVRPLAVLRKAGEPSHVPELPGAPGVDLSLPSDAVAADLEIRILIDPDHDGRLLWTFATRHAGIDLPDEVLRTDIGDARGFARELVDKVNAKEGKVGVYNRLAGIGVEISRNVPDELWELLRAVASRVGDAPDVLILSAEPYVPWELAKMEEPLLDAAAPPFLAAQANVGRWMLPSQDRDRVPSSRQRPRQPPPTEVVVTSMAVVSGVYDRPGWSRLKEAEAEADDLNQRYKAVKVDAQTSMVLECLDGTPPADLLHFAVHGSYDPGGLQDGLMLVDGEPLDPFEVQGATLGRSPFVFLNACQVGSGNRILGDYGGMSAAFLVAGAAGVVAPLWKVK